MSERGPRYDATAGIGCPAVAAESAAVHCAGVWSCSADADPVVTVARPVATVTVARVAETARRRREDGVMRGRILRHRPGGQRM
ncbi:hypothetical protein ACUY2Q_06705 [Corynebacterium bovis]